MNTRRTIKAESDPYGFLGASDEARKTQLRQLGDRFGKVAGMIDSILEEVNTMHKEDVRLNPQGEYVIGGYISSDEFQILQEASALASDIQYMISQDVRR